MGVFFVAQWFSVSPASLLRGLSVESAFGEQLTTFLTLLAGFVVFFPFFLSTWMFWRNELFKENLKWILLEIKIPREIDKSPKAMEQVFEAIHALRNTPGDIREYFWDGEVTRWYSLEMVSLGGEIHLYIRLYYKQRDLVEAAFFSYYKDVELVEVDDYADAKFPAGIREMYAQGYDMWGSEMVLAKPAAYPIRTYVDFESIEEERQFDPISNFLEVLAKAKKEEIVGIQMLIAPADRNWYKKYEPIVEELSKTTRDDKKAANLAMDFSGGAPLPNFSVVTKKSDDLSVFSKTFSRTPGKTDVIKAIEENLSKHAFQTLIRFIYFSPKSIFYDSYARRGLSGAFNQYGSLDLNFFVQNYSMSTRTRFWNKPYVFPASRNEYRKQRLLYTYRYRKLPIRTVMGKLLTSYLWNWNIHSRMFEMNTACLATLFHPPTRYVLTAPHIKRVESRKTGPPAGLAIFGEEEKIEKFM